MQREIKTIAGQILSLFHHRPRDIDTPTTETSQAKWVISIAGFSCPRLAECWGGQHADTCDFAGQLDATGLALDSLTPRTTSRIRRDPLF